MRKYLLLLCVFILVSCNRKSSETGIPVITVSIAPFEYFVKSIGGDDFSVNVMVPPGANPHVYEPFPRQIADLRKSVAYVSNGYLGFEMAWLDRFYEMNKKMIKLSLGDGIDLIESEHAHEHENDHAEGADPHYWVSPKYALDMALSIEELLCKIKPEGKEKYENNLADLKEKILMMDKKADSLFSEYKGESFMIYHPNLAYLARDYGLNELPVEFEGKEPPPSRLKELIDLAREKKIATIFVQKEYDTRNARAIAGDIRAEIIVIDPLSGDWEESTGFIIDALHKSFAENR
ncbi:MAG TPA: zinc ABC transporter substrate-binding protein [Bacteroidales bacterium]|nr:zinc ABC transporter substrate-binding protein [Bacteroidales bacterium]